MHGVRQAVVVEIDHPGAPADIAGLDADPGLDRHVVEEALAVAAIEAAGVVREVRLEQIDAAVEVVVVAGGDAHARLLQAVLAERHAALERLFLNVPSR